MTLAATDEALSAELELGSGRTNQNLVATVNDGSGRRYFVRTGGDIPAYGVTRAREQAAGRAAAAAGIGPAVLFTSPDAMVTDFLPGKTLTDTELKAACAGTGDPNLLSQVAATLRKLHAAPAPAELGGLSESSGWAPADMWRWLVQAEEAGYDRLPVVADARKLIVLLEEKAGSPSEPCFCHFDLLPDNLVRAPATTDNDGKRTVSVIDFEYAGVGQRLLDLAIMSMGSDLEPDEEANLLAAYTGHAPTAELKQSFSALKVLASLRETLWGVTAEVTRASALPMSEAVSYTDENWGKLVKYRAAFDEVQL